MPTHNERSEVTAQDFLQVIVQDKSDSPMIFVGETLEAFDALLSQVRQEARREALQEMDMCRSMQLGATETVPEWSMKLLKLRMEYQKPN